MYFHVILSVLLLCLASTLALPVLRSDLSRTTNDGIKLHLLISARTRSVEIYVKNAPVNAGDKIIVTSKPFDELTKASVWNADESSKDVLGVFQPRETNDWIETNLKFDYKQSELVDETTSCYSDWITYTDANGNVLASNCMRAYPTWMNDMKDDIKELNMKQILLPGAHDAGSYRPNFDPEKQETLLTKYSLNQDDNIRGQLMHGIRYLDIRIGYYSLSKDKFHIVHGIIKQRPLREALEQLRDFVIATNEIVIFDIHKLEGGFQAAETHHELVAYIKSYIGEYLVDARQTWGVSLDQIWQSGKNIILTYDNRDIINQYPDMLFTTVNHRWGNKDKWEELEQYLKSIHGTHIGIGSDMAELTPNALGVILDTYGGLRKMADDINDKVSHLYEDQLGATTNILSVDFYRGTLVTEIAIHFNRLRKQAMNVIIKS